MPRDWERKKKRPTPVRLPKAQFEQMCRIHCTLTEIAGVFDIDQDTLTSWAKREYGETARVVRDRFADEGKMNLRRKMFQLALDEDKPSEKMLLHLAKHHLGQIDTSVNVQADVQVLSNEELKELLPRALQRMGLSGEVIASETSLIEGGDSERLGEETDSEDGAVKSDRAIQQTPETE